MLMKKMWSCKKSRKSSSAAVGAAGNRAAGLTARQSDVGLTSTWLEAALLDVNGSPDVPDISISLQFSSSSVTTLRSICISSTVLLGYHVPSRPDID